MQVTTCFLQDSMFAPMLQLGWVDGRSAHIVHEVSCRSAPWLIHDSDQKQVHTFKMQATCLVGQGSSLAAAAEVQDHVYPPSV